VGPRDPAAGRGHAQGPGAAPVVPGEHHRASQRLSPGGQLPGPCETWPGSESDTKGLLLPTQPSDKLRGAPMRKLYSLTFLSLDGVMEAPDQWHFAYYSDEMAKSFATSWNRRAPCCLAGSPTRSSPPTGPSSPPTPRSRTSTTTSASTSCPPAWTRPTGTTPPLINRSIPEQIRQLKQQPGGDLHLTGSATLVRALLDQGLLDELRIQVSGDRWVGQAPVPRRRCLGGLDGAAAGPGQDAPARRAGAGLPSRSTLVRQCLAFPYLQGPPETACCGTPSPRGPSQRALAIRLPRRVTAVTWHRDGGCSA
jgi:dihydrofolate reductase